jgi:hypothetical protein
MLLLLLEGGLEEPGQLPLAALSADTAAAPGPCAAPALLLLLLEVEGGLEEGLAA